MRKRKRKVIISKQSYRYLSLFPYVQGEEDEIEEEEEAPLILVREHSISSHSVNITDVGSGTLVSTDILFSFETDIGLRFE